MKIRFFIAILLLSVCNWLEATTITVGNTGNYSSVKAALASLGTITEPAVIVLQSDYTQTSEEITDVAGSGPVNTVTIRPATILSISGNGATLWNLNGCHHIIIDGRISGGDGSKALSLSNTSTTGITIQFINDASDNTVKYVNLYGANTGITAGTVTFGTTTGTTGNDNNVIDNCNIGDGVTTPAFGVYSLGTAADPNDGNIISNNNIYNYYKSSNTSYGGYGICFLGNTSGATISGNSFYQTTARTAFGNGSINGAILINNPGGNGFIIKDNFIGGQSSMCGSPGTPYISGSTATTTHRFLGISLSVGNTTSTYIYNNTFQNLSVFSGNTTPSACISLQAGLIKCGLKEDDTPAGNIIGSPNPAMTGNNASILFTGTMANSYFTGIYINSSTASTPVVVSNNNIAGITGTSTNITITSPVISYLSGITIGGTGSQSTYSVRNNNIGNGAVGVAESNMSIQNFAARAIYGIHVLAGNSNSIVNISDNNINNLAQLAPNSSTTNAGYFGGIVTNNIFTQVNINNNIVRDLSATVCSSSNTGTYPLHAGIAVLSQNTANTVTGNTVYNLAGAKTMIDGILIANGGGSSVSGNNIFNVFTTNTSSGNGNAGANGIRVIAGGTYAPNLNVNNNMIRLGNDRNGESVTSLCPFTGIRDTVTTSAISTVSYYHNTVYIGGDGVNSGTNPTFAFFSTGATGANLTRNIQNNIFANTRSSISGTGIHYALKLGSMNGLNGNLNIDYNDYVTNGTGGLLANITGQNKTTISEIQSGTNKDSHSINFNPVFVNSLAAMPDLHINSSNSVNNVLISGLAIESVKTDFDGEQRGSSPVIGADEFVNKTLPPFISLSKSTISISYYKNSNGTVDVFSNVTWTAFADKSWLYVNPVSSATGNASISFYADANPDFSPRTAQIIVSDGNSVSDTITVTQEARSEIDKTEYLQIILYGQSLGLGWQCPRAITTVPVTGNYMLGNNVNMQYNNGTTVLNPLIATKWANGGEQPIVACVNAFSAVYRDSIDANQKFIAMTAGEGGRTIERLSKECTNSGYYASTFLSILDNTLLALEGKTVSCPAVIYMQGEYNCSAGGAAGQGLTPGTNGTLDKNVYKNLLLKLKNNMQADIMSKYGQTQKPLFFIYQTSGKYISSVEMPIVMAQREFAEENTDVILMNPHYALPDYTGGHLSTNGYRWYGEMMAKSLTEVLIRKNTFKTLKPVDFVIEGPSITINYQVPVPPLVLDTMTTPRETNYGFTVYRNGAVVPVSQVKIISDNQVQINCNTVLNGKIDIVYAGNTTNGSGNLRDSDQPVSMYTYFDDSGDGLRESYTPQTQTGGSIYGQHYGLQNWSDEFYYSFNVVTTGNKSPEEIDSVNIYPNPASGFINVNYHLADDQNGELLMYNAQGKQIHKQNITGKNNSVTVKTDGLKPGLYLCNIKANNAFSGTCKFVVKK